MSEIFKELNGLEILKAIHPILNKLARVYAYNDTYSKIHKPTEKQLNNIVSCLNVAAKQTFDDIKTEFKLTSLEFDYSTKTLQFSTHHKGYTFNYKLTPNNQAFKFYYPTKQHEYYST